MTEGFSRDAAMALFDYLEELEEECGTPMEFDRVGIRCQFSEYGSATEVAQDRGWEPEEGEDEDDIEEAAMKFLERDGCSVIEFRGGVIIGE
jgi:hypothetical protein